MPGGEAPAPGAGGPGLSALSAARELCAGAVRDATASCGTAVARRQFVRRVCRDRLAELQREVTEARGREEEVGADLARLRRRLRRRVERECGARPQYSAHAVEAIALPSVDPLSVVIRGQAEGRVFGTRRAIARRDRVVLDLPWAAELERQQARDRVQEMEEKEQKRRSIRDQRSMLDWQRSEQLRREEEERRAKEAYRAREKADHEAWVVEEKVKADQSRRRLIRAKAQMDFILDHQRSVRSEAVAQERAVAVAALEDNRRRMADDAQRDRERRKQRYDEWQSWQAEAAKKQEESVAERRDVQANDAAILAWTARDRPTNRELLRRRILENRDARAERQHAASAPAFAAAAARAAANADRERRLQAEQAARDAAEDERRRVAVRARNAEQRAALDGQLAEAEVERGRERERHAAGVAAAARARDEAEEVRRRELRDAEISKRKRFHQLSYLSERDREKALRGLNIKIK